jgi:RNA polymerase sigma-70 factor, ECF subfamily
VIRASALASVGGEHSAAADHNATLTPDALCELYASRVFQFATMAAGSDAEAEDIAQSALERALRALPRFDPNKGRLEAWLWRIVVNVARDAGRTATRRRLLFERLVHFRGPVSAVPDDIPDGIENVELLAAVRALTPMQRSVIALRYGADLEFSDVGKALGVSRTAAAVTGHRALKSLRRKLLEDHR